MQLNMIALDEAKKLVKPGWLIQYRGTGLISSWIRLVTGGIHSHTAMVVEIDKDGEPIVAEVREFIGGRLSKLTFQWEQFGGHLDFYEPKTDHFPELNISATTIAMKQIALRAKYNYWNLAKILVRKLPFLWRFFDRGINDDLIVQIEDKRWHCSDSVAASYQFGGVDPVHYMPNDLVAPSDLTRSLLFDYRFSL